MSGTASFTPITVTAETLSRLSKEKKYGDLLALYMACVEITVWQHGNNIKASRSFMMNRLNWGEDRLTKAKTKLVEMGLLENVTRKEKGMITGHYILVKHVIQSPEQLEPSAGFHHGVDSEGTNTNELKLNTNNYNNIGDFENSNDTFGGSVIPPNSAAPPTALLEKLIQIINPREKATSERQRVLNGRLKDYTEDEIIGAAHAFAKSTWHRENKQMSVDNLLAPSKFGRWYAQREEQASAPRDGFPRKDANGDFWYDGEKIDQYNTERIEKKIQADRAKRVVDDGPQ